MISQIATLTEYEEEKEDANMSEKEKANSKIVILKQTPGDNDNQSEQNFIHALIFNKLTLLKHYRLGAENYFCNQL